MKHISNEIKDLAVLENTWRTDDQTKLKRSNDASKKTNSAGCQFSNSECFLQIPCLQKQLQPAKKRGRIHGQYQSRTSGQGRKCTFFHFSTRAHGPSDGRTDGQTGQKDKASSPRLKIGFVLSESIKIGFVLSETILTAVISCKITAPEVK